MIGLPNPYVLLGAGMAALAIAVGGYVKGHHDGFAELKADWDAQQLRQMRDYAARVEDNRRENERIKAAYQAKEATYAKRQDDDARRIADLSGLVRKFPERAAPVPAAASGNEAAACEPGPRFHRVDAAFLIAEAERANQLRAALERCQGGDVVQDGGRLDH